MPVINDLIELNGLASNTTYSFGDGSILGVIDGSTLSGDDDNTETSIVELNNSDRDGGLLTVGGVDYYIFLVTPDGEDQPVTLTDGTGSQVDVTGGERTTDVAFIRALPVGEGPTRYFAVLDDSVGDINIQSLQTRELDFTPAGGDVDITLTADNDIDIVCFASGTMIDTAEGPRAIEEIAEGDLVLTRDNGMQPVAWVGARTLSAKDLSDKPALCPIRIRAGSLGEGVPAADLIVSPQHRILVRSAIAMRMFGAQEVLVAAKQLLTVEGIDRASDLTAVTYHHILFADHQIVMTNGAETESLFTGPEALKGVSTAAREEILALFPQLAHEGFVPMSIRPFAQGRQARTLTSRHMKNSRPLVS